MKPVAKVSLAACAGGLVCAACLWRRAVRREADGLAKILGWRPGARVADVGAGSGALAIVAARLAGPGGQVLATEIDPKKLARIRKKVLRLGMSNVTAIQAEQRRSGLPAGCCEAILLRGSYHHFTDPAAITADLYRTVGPGGVVAVVDFLPRRWLTLLAPVKGAPASRGGHGIPAGVLIEEMTAAGFAVEEKIARWFLDAYCVVFRKPAAAI